MSDFTAATNRIQRAYQTYRLAIAVAGTVAVVVGLVILLWPSVVIQVIAISIGAYAVEGAQISPTVQPDARRDAAERVCVDGTALRRLRDAQTGT